MISMSNKLYRDYLTGIFVDQVGINKLKGLVEDG
jgi:hypothetical protein